MPSNGSRHEDDALGPPRQPDGDDRQAPRVRDLRAGREEGSAEELRVLPDPFAGAYDDGEDAGSAPGPEELEKVTLEKVTKERDDLLDALRRMQADFENYKKRVERQSAEVRDRANERIVERMLPALDAFAMARAHMAEADASAEGRALLQAAALFEDALSKEGLERIDAKDVAFDPTSHEAVEHRDATDDDLDEVTGDAASGDGAAGESSVGEGDGEGEGARQKVVGPVIDEIYRPGYIWKGRVLRPAMVRVRG
jgi:molecular chaperone GrpE